MNRFIGYSVGVLVLTILVVGISIAFVSQLRPLFASVTQGNEYNVFLATAASSSPLASTVLKNSYGSLGSVVISSSTPITATSSMVIYDASSTMATATSRILAKFGTNNQTHGTYQFDVIANYGIKVDLPAGFNGVYTVTYR